MSAPLSVASKPPTSQSSIDRAKQLQEDRAQGLTINLPGAKISELSRELMQIAFQERGSGINLTPKTALPMAMADVLAHLGLIFSSPEGKRSILAKDEYINTSVDTIRNACRSDNISPSTKQNAEAFLVAATCFYGLVFECASTGKLRGQLVNAETHARALLSSVE